MTRNVMTLAPDADVADAAWGLTVKGIGGAPVRDAAGHVLGLVSKSDLIDPARMKPGEKSGAPTKVEDVMTPAVFAVRSSDSVRETARRMVETGSHRMLVVGSEGKLVGIVTTMDVLKALVHGDLDEDARREAPPEPRSPGA